MTQTLKSLLRGVLWVWRSRFAKSEKGALLAALYRVKFAAVKQYGICGEFNRYYHGKAAEPGKELKRLFALWPKFSGCAVYPVPGSGVAFSRAVSSKRLWSGEYGQLRKELLNFMIEQLEKELAE